MPDNLPAPISETDALLSEWKAALALRIGSQELSPNSAATYQRGMTTFLKWFMASGHRAVTADVIRQWMAELFEKYGSSNAVNVRLSGVRSFFAWAVEAEHIQENPTARIKSAARKGAKHTHKRDTLTDQEVVRLLKQPNRKKPRGKRDYCILALMLYTAVRTVELHRANLADLRTKDRRQVLEVQGKGKHEKEDVVLPAPAVEAVQDWLAVRGGQPGPLFVSLSARDKGARLSLRTFREVVRGSLDSAGIVDRRKTTHSLRHAAATKLVQKVGPVRARMVTRHTSLETLMIYVHDIERFDDPPEDHIDYGA